MATYNFTSGKLPASGINGDKFVMNGVNYTYSNGAWRTAPNPTFVTSTDIVDGSVSDADLEESYLKTSGGTLTGQVTLVGTNSNLVFETSGNNITFYRNADNYISAVGGTSSNIVLSPQNRLVINAGGGERMRVTSAGIDVTGVINTTGSITLPNNSSFKTKSVAGGVYGIAKIDTGNNIRYGGYDYTSAAVNMSIGDHFKFVNNNGTEEYMRIHPGGIGIGTNGAQNYALEAKGLVIGNNSDHVGLTFASAANRSGHIYFSKDTIGDGKYRGFIVYKHDGDYLSIGTAATERMHITSSGNVGIGHSAPLRTLELGSAGAKLRVGPDYYTLNGSTDRDFIELQAHGSDTKIVSPNERFHIENTSGDIILNAGGGVGIGTTNPGYKLHVANPGSGIIFKTERTDAGGYFTIAHTSQKTHFNSEQDYYFKIGGYEKARLNGSKFSAASYIEVGSQGGLDLTVTGGGSGIGAFTEWRYGVDGVANSRIKGNGDSFLNVNHGDVGIGTSSPGYKLDVSGSGNFSDNTFFNNPNHPTCIKLRRSGTSGSQIELANSYAPTIGGTYSSGWAFFTSNARQNVAGANSWEKGSSTYTSNKIGLGISTDGSSTAFGVYHSPANTAAGAGAYFYTQNLFVVKENGNVGIGVTPNAAYRLHVPHKCFLGTTAIDDGAVIIHGGIQQDNGPGSPWNLGKGVNGSTTSSFRIDYGSLNTMTIDSGGFVGIGTTTPDAPLTVYSTDAARYVKFKAPGGEKRFDFYVGSTGNPAVLNMYTHDGTTKNVQISSGGDTYFNGGNVGIGTASPSVPLEVFGSDNGITISAAIANRPQLRFKCGTAETLRLSANSLYGAIGDSSNTDRYMIFKGGNIGIGTSSPDVKLQVYDTANSDPSPPGTATTGMFALNNSTQATLSIGKNSGNTYWISNVNRAFAGSYYNISLNPLGGKVGVGTTSPVQKLHVEGRIHSSTSSSSDTVVFDRYNGSGTHTIATITGTNSGLTVVARLDWVGLYSYAGTTHGAGSKIASTRRTINGTAWGDLDNIDIGSSGNTTGFTLYWENGVLKWTINPSWQITGRISITYHNAASFVVN